MKVECSKCFADVIPMEGDLCPSCGKPVSGGPSHLTKVTFSHKDGECGVCIKCGSETTNRTTYKKSAKNTNYQPDAQRDDNLIALLLNWIEGKHKQVVEVQVPVCDLCSNDKLPEPHHINFETRKVTFLAHRNCKEAIAARQSSLPDTMG